MKTEEGEAVYTEFEIHYRRLWLGGVYYDKDPKLRHFCKANGKIIIKKLIISLFE